MYSKNRVQVRLFLVVCMLMGSLLTGKKQLQGAQPAWDDTLDFEEIEQRLQQEKVVAKKNMHSFLRKTGKIPSGMHQVKLVVLESGLKAVHKKGGAAYGEIGAYKASQALGLRLVPPTIAREIDGVEGSLQFFVETPIDLMCRAYFLKKLRRKDRSDKEIFNHIFGQWDDHRGNHLISTHNGNYYLALIDNAGIILQIEAKKLQERVFFTSTLEALKKLDEATLASVWSHFMPVSEKRVRYLIERTLARRDKLVNFAQTKGKVVHD